jgi:hypothetical protein
VHRVLASIVLAANVFNLAPLLAQTPGHKNFNGADAFEELEQQK